MGNEIANRGEILLYSDDSGKEFINVVFKDETFWLTQKAMAELFDVNVPAVSKHLQNIYEENELTRDATISKMEIVRQEGERNLQHKNPKRDGNYRGFLGNSQKAGCCLDFRV